MNIVEDIRDAKDRLRPKSSLLQAQRLDPVANGKRDERYGSHTSGTK
jgi:hypothetical protein